MGFILVIVCIVGIIHCGKWFEDIQELHRMNKYSQDLEVLLAEKEIENDKLKERVEFLEERLEEYEAI